MKRWNKAKGFPTSHNRPALIEQAKTKKRVKVTNKGRKNERPANLEGTSWEDAIEVEPDLGVSEPDQKAGKDTLADTPTRDKSPWKDSVC